MQAMIGRTGCDVERIFPPITPALYSDGNGFEGLSPAQKATSDLLARGNKKLIWQQRFWGRGLDYAEQFDRVLFHHRLAMEAELAARWTRADFFWRQVYNELEALKEKSDVWASLTTEFVAKTDYKAIDEPAQFRKHIFNELFIDAHCGFYNGLIQATGKLNRRSRAFAHLDYICALLRFSTIPEEQLASVIGPALKTRVELLTDANKLDAAIEAARLLVHYFPAQTDYQSSLARLYFTNTVAQLRNRKSEASNSRDAETLGTGIVVLEKLCRSYPYNLLLYQLVGQLYYIRSIKLAGSGSLSASLVDVQKALTYWPLFEEAKKTRIELLAAMRQLQGQMKNVIEQLRTHSNASLNEKGQKIAYEAQRGFTPVEKYIASEEAKMTAKAFSVVQARYIWQQIGLPIPEDNWNEQAVALIQKLNSLLAESSADLESPSIKWQQIVSENEEFATYDVNLVCAFLAKQDTKKADEKADEKQSAEQPTVESFDTPDNPPLLTPVSTKRRLSSEPFSYWMLSARDMRVKFQAVAAILLVIVASGLTIWTARADQGRNDAYQKLIDAQARQDYLVVVEEAERFLANPSPLKSDKRKPQVESFYNEAFVYWFMEQESALDEEALAHIDRYKALNISVNSQEGN